MSLFQVEGLQWDRECHQPPSMAWSPVPCAELGEEHGVVWQEQLMPGTLANFTLGKHLKLTSCGFFQCALSSFLEDYPWYDATVGTCLLPGFVSDLTPLPTFS